MIKKRFHTSLQLKLTLLLSLLMIVSCVLMYFFISHSAVSGMDGLQNYMIKVDPQDGDSPITFNVDPKALFPQFEQEIQETKEDFLLRSVIATTIIILLSSVCTYFLTKKTLTPLQKLTSEVTGFVHKLSLLSFIQQLLLIIIKIVFSLLKVIEPVLAVLQFCLLATTFLQWIKCLPSTHH